MSKPQIHILIVEDDLVDRMACRRALAQDENYEFLLAEADTGREGLRLAHEHKPDCVLLDYHLPDLDGLEFLSELKNDVGEITVPVMMLTGADNASIAVEALKRGAHDYLVKDANRQYLELLPAVIERVLRERQAWQEKKEMESRLVQAEAQYRFLVEQIPAITYTAALDIPGKLLYVSPQLGVLGYSPEEMIGQDGGLRSYVHPDDRQRAQEAFDQVRVTGKRLRCEYRLLDREGDVHWFLDEASLVSDEYGRPLMLQGILIDITADKKVEEELRQHRRHIDDLVAVRTTQLEKQLDVYKSANSSLSSELRTRTDSETRLKVAADRLADLYNNAPCGYHSLDAAGVIIQVNDTQLKWHDLPREVVVGKMKFADLLTPQSRKTFEEHYPHLLKRGWVRNLELQIARKGGDTMTVLLSANADKDDYGQFMMSRSILFDITGR